MGRGNNKARREGRRGRSTSRAAHDGVTLSQRELDVLRLSAQGMGMMSICAELDISRTSVQAIRRNIKNKFGLDSDAPLGDMVYEGRRRGFISL